MPDEFSFANTIRSVVSQVENVWEAPTFVAGGFIRDMVLGVLPKDIDVFIFAPESGEKGWNGPLKHLEALAERMAGIMDVKPLNPDFTYPIEEGGTEVVGVLELEDEWMMIHGGVYHSLPVQIIMVDGFTPDTILDRFDYGACRAMSDGKSLITHPHFHEDLEQKVFRLRRPREDLQLMSSVERYARFKQREEFRDWKWQPFNSARGEFPFDLIDFVDVNSVAYSPPEPIDKYLVEPLA